MISEKRKSPRSVKYIDVVCTTASGERMTLKTRDLSDKGLALSIMRKYHSFNINDKIQLEINDSSQKEVLSGKVIRVLDHVVVVEIEKSKRKAERIIGEFVIKTSLSEMPNLILHTKNYSSNGIFVILDERFHKLKIKDEIKIEMFLPDDLSKKQLCKIVRIEDLGIALEFI